MSRPRSVLLAALLAAVAAPGPAAAAELRIFPVAGGAPGFGGDGGPAWRARMSPTAVQPAADGGLLVLDAHSERVRRIAPDGTVTTVAGTGVRGFRGDGGPATAARFRLGAEYDGFSHGLTALPDGGYVVADTGNQRLRRVDAAGRITTVAGTGDRGYDLGRLYDPDDLAATPAGDLLVAAGTVRRLAPDGALSTAFGRAPCIAGDPWDLEAPVDLDVAADGSVLVVDAACVWRLRDGTLEPLAGGPAWPPPPLAYDGPARAVSMADAVAVAALPDGGAYVALEAGPNGQAEGSVRRLWPGGRMTTVLGCGTGCVPAAEGAEGRRVAVLPYGVAAMPGGGFVVATSAGLLRVGDDGLVHPVPGPAIWSPVALPGGEVLGTQTCSYALPACDPAPVAADSTRIVRLRADGTVVPIAGGGAASGDVPVATDAAIVPSSPTVAPDGRIVFLDTRIDAVRRVTPDGALVTVATVARPGKGTGDPGVALAAAPDGTFVFAAEGGRLDRISPDGTVTPLGGRLPDPLAAPDEWWRVAATGDGGLVLARYLSGDGVLRVVAVAPDGRRTIARRTVGEDWAPEAPLGLAGWPGRDVLVSFAGRLHRLAGDRLRVVDGDREPGFFGTTDGARLADVRLGWAEDLVPAGDGATYVVGDGRIRMLAAEGAAPPAVAITRESLRLAARRALVVRTTRPGRVTVEARDRRGRVVGRGRQEVEGGRVVVRLPRRLSGVVRATAVLRTAGGARAGDEQALLLGRALPVRAARQLAEDSPWAPPRASAADEDPIDERLVGGCRRLSRTRVDCRTEAADGTTWVGWTSRSCAILAIRLDRDGIVRLRGYGERAARRPDRRCGARERAPFAARPRWDAPRWWEAAPLRTP